MRRTLIRLSRWLAAATSLAALAGRGHAQSQTLSVLSPHGLLDFKIISEFERTTRINLRVELTTGRREHEMRLKHSVSNWDVVIADETELATLAYARLTRPLRDEKEPASGAGPMAARMKSQEETKGYVALMADPLGITWLEGTRSTDTPPSWKDLVDPTHTPFWRGRVFLPSEPQFQFRIAMLATGMTNPQAPLSAMASAFDWLKAAHHQSAHKSSQLVLSLLQEKAAAGPMWKSDYLKVRKLARAMEFAIPPEGTFYTRLGAAVAADTLREDLALNFISFLVSRRDDLARFAGLLPLSSTANDIPGLGSWRAYDETIPLHRDVEESLRKISR